MKYREPAKNTTKTKVISVFRKADGMEVWQTCVVKNDDTELILINIRHKKLKLVRNIKQKNPELKVYKLWHRLQKRKYSRSPKSLFQVTNRNGMLRHEVSQLPLPFSS